MNKFGVRHHTNLPLPGNLRQGTDIHIRNSATFKRSTTSDFQDCERLNF